jgi:hypothetical protein
MDTVNNPAFAIAHRIGIQDCKVPKGEDYIEFSPMGNEHVKMRIDRRRIVFLEYGEKVMPNPYGPEMDD